MSGHLIKMYARHNLSLKMSKWLSEAVNLRTGNAMATKKQLGTEHKLLIITNPTKTDVSYNLPYGYPVHPSLATPMMLSV